MHHVWISCTLIYFKCKNSFLRQIFNFSQSISSVLFCISYNMYCLINIYSNTDTIMFTPSLNTCTQQQRNQLYVISWSILVAIAQHCCILLSSKYSRQTILAGSLHTRCWWWWCCCCWRRMIHPIIIGVRWCKAHVASCIFVIIICSVNSTQNTLLVCRRG